ncbi:hypothetical protein C8Q77DRAFT_1061934 [Trametes polyzona]|nr:hypothetical protein C8Q77DRAFT_1061934 [Trametes polyzona]
MLNLDIIHLVCDAALDIPTILSLSRVSRTLRPMAAKQLLAQKKPVVLGSERVIRSFHMFLLAERGVRARFVRALSIVGNRITMTHTTFPPNVLSCLLDILNRATLLESLSMPPSYWVFDGVQLSRAIGGLANLRELKLLHHCGQVESIVKSIRSAPLLRILRVSLHSFVPSNPTHVTTTDLDALLSPLLPTLEVLEITDKEAAFTTRGLIYPELRSLSVGLMVPWRIDVLIAKFPKLDAILDLTPGYVRILQETTPQQEQDIRAANIIAQKKGTWRKLDRVVGELYLLYMLAIECPIHHLLVDDISPRNMTQLTEVLCTSPPARLTLTMRLNFGNVLSAGLFPEAVVPKLSHLAILLTYTSDRFEDTAPAVQTFRWSDLLASIISSIGKLELTHFRLYIHYSINMDEYDPSDTYYTGAFPPEPFVTDLIRLRHEEASAALMAAIPSLQCVFITVRGDMYNLSRHDRNWASRLESTPWWPHRPWSEHSGCTRTPRVEPIEVEKLGDDILEQAISDEGLRISEMDDGVSVFVCPMYPPSGDRTHELPTARRHTVFDAV